MATDPTEAMLADVATVAGGVAPVAGNSPITRVANPVRAIMLKLRIPRDLPVTVLTSSSIAPADLIALAPSAVVSAMDDASEISAAKATLVHQDDAPTSNARVRAANARLIAVVEGGPAPRISARLGGIKGLVRTSVMTGRIHPFKPGERARSLSAAFGSLSCDR